MIQLCFPFGSERTLPFRNISPLLEDQPYFHTVRQRKFDFTRSSLHGRGASRHKKALFKGHVTVACCYCKKELSYEEATVEHIQQRSKGGTNQRDNVTIACSPCNNHRQNYSFEEWKAIVQSPAGHTVTRTGTVKHFANRYLALYDFLKMQGRLIERRYLR